jgi:hypothetical protein
MDCKNNLEKPVDVENQISNAVWIDLDDAPELDDKFFERADEYLGKSLVKLSQPEVAK